MAKKNTVNYMVDLEAVATTIGAMEAAAEVAGSDSYIGKLINAAHAKVADEFDAHIIADAMTTTAFNHMFEWGTAGINKGRTTRRISPNSPEAKLWDHVIIGSGRSKSVDFHFIPSKVPVPLPTTGQTGIDQKYLNRLKGKHIFWNKAAVMETGAEVHIEPKNGAKLFIPLGVGKTDDPRGFVMTSKPVTVVPGGRNIGTFSAYWEKFWNGLGQEGMQAHMEEGLLSHLERVQQTAQRTKGRLMPASSNEAAKAASRGRALGTKQMRQQAIERERVRSHT